MLSMALKCMLGSMEERTLPPLPLNVIGHTAAQDTSNLSCMRLVCRTWREGTNSAVTAVRLSKLPPAGTLTVLNTCAITQLCCIEPCLEALAASNINDVLPQFLQHIQQAVPRLNSLSLALQPQHYQLLTQLQGLTNLRAMHLPSEEPSGQPPAVTAATHLDALAQLKQLQCLRLVNDSEPSYSALANLKTVTQLQLWREPHVLTYPQPAQPPPSPATAVSRSSGSSSSGSRVGSTSGTAAADQPAAQARVLELGLHGISLGGVGHLTHLVSLSLRHATHSWRLPESLTLLTRLKELDVSRNALAHLPDGLGALTQLTHLNIANCCLTELPDSFSCLQALEQLTANGNPGLALPLGSTQLTRLEHLDLAWGEGSNICRILELAPASFARLRTLNLRGHNLVELSPVFAELTALESLTLSVNPLGRVPDELVSLRELKSLDLSMCQLEGLPDDIASWWPKLRRLEAQVNGLAELPRDITKLGCLEYLDISYNMISHVPTALSRLVCLRDIKARCTLLPSSALASLRSLPLLTVSA